MDIQEQMASLGARVRDLERMGGTADDWRRLELEVFTLVIEAQQQQLAHQASMIALVKSGRDHARWVQARRVALEHVRVLDELRQLRLSAESRGFEARISRPRA